MVTMIFQVDLRHLKHLSLNTPNFLLVCNHHKKIDT